MGVLLLYYYSGDNFGFIFNRKYQLFMSFIFQLDFDGNKIEKNIKNYFNLYNIIFFANKIISII